MRGRGRRRPGGAWLAFAVLGVLALAASGCSSSDGGATKPTTSGDGTTTTDRAVPSDHHRLVGSDGRFALPAPRLAKQVALAPTADGGAVATFRVAYAVAHPTAAGGAKPDQAQLVLRVATAMAPTGPLPTHLAFEHRVTDTHLDAEEITRSYRVAIPAAAYHSLVDHGLGSSDASERAAALRLVTVGVNQDRDFQQVDGRYDWIHGSTFDASTSPTKPADDPGGAVTVSNDTAEGIWTYPWSTYDEPVGQAYGPNLVPTADRMTQAASSSEGVTIAMSGQAVSCLYQNTDGSNPSGFTTALAPGVAITQTIVADDKGTDDPTGSNDTAQISEAVIQSIGAVLTAVATITEAGASAPFTLIVKIADQVLSLSTACNNQPNQFILAAVTQDGQGTNATTWAIDDGCSGTCGGLANVYSSPWQSSAPNSDAQMATEAVQLAPSTVTYQGQPLWLAQVPTQGCGVGNGSSSNTSGCTSQNWISLRWVTEPPCPWANGLELANGTDSVQGDVSWCFQDPPTSPEIPSCGTDNAGCVAYDPTS
ncbi:MAG: hypothetical protein U0P45_07645 [Acidimicrobiales bacterium]